MLGGLFVWRGGMVSWESDEVVRWGGSLTIFIFVRVEANLRGNTLVDWGVGCWEGEFYVLTGYHLDELVHADNGCGDRAGAHEYFRIRCVMEVEGNTYTAPMRNTPLTAIFRPVGICRPQIWK